MKLQARMKPRSRRGGGGRAHDDAPIGLALISSEWRFLQVNPRLCTLLGYTRKQLLSRTLGAVIDPLDQQLMESNSRRLLAGEIDEFQSEQHFLHADGRHFPGRFSASVTTGVGNRSFACVLEIDAPGERGASRTQKNSREAFTVLDDFFDGVLAADESGRIACFNQAAGRLFGYESAEVVGREAGLIIAGPCQEEFADFLAGWASSGWEAAPSRPREMWGRRKDGSTFPIEIRASRMILGGEPHLVAILRDISEQKAQTEALEYQTLHDVLTNLPNRTLLNDRLHQAILTGSRQRRTAALLILDVDGFKEVNDTCGHHTGDLLLQQIALRLEGLLRSSDTVARLGGDEFAILPGLGIGGEDGARTAQKVLRVLEQPFMIDGRVLRISASIGIALFPAHGRDASSLMRHADEAMYVAKRARSGYAFHVPRQHAVIPEHRVQRGELGHAIEHDQMVLHFQPTIDLRIGRTIGVEALVRWQHPEQGLLLPMSFIPVAEEAGLIMPLTRWVLNRALRQARAWSKAGLDIDVAVNLSAGSLLDAGLPAMTSDLLKVWRFDPGRLKADLSESSVMAAPAVETATRLGAMGIGLAIDDFGAGAASLLHLARLPVREVKIDGARGDDSTLRPIVDQGHRMGFRMAAKRVEDQATLDRLRGLGCDSAQGFHLCPPIVAADVAPWLRDSAWGLAARTQ
ncbi:MAG TPA: EAL domain-containing protein [Candidatus Polarisedimenticolia bacterium]|nr:EAL domain-containing protein [Candidatus Polarisedimenticolia bacterium]